MESKSELCFLEYINQDFLTFSLLGNSSHQAEFDKCQPSFSADWNLMHLGKIVTNFVISVFKKQWTLSLIL